ncbi:MAG: ABC transporter substrate-binding protein [Haliangiales bacterium]
MRSERRSGAALIAALLMIAGLGGASGCGKSANHANDNTGDSAGDETGDAPDQTADTDGAGVADGDGAAGRRQIVLLADWIAEAEQGGYYQALATGRYRAAGLDVDIRSGGPSINTRQLLAAGMVDFALGGNNDDALELLRAGSQVRAVMAGFQKSPQILMTHPQNGIESLADMRGKPIHLAASNIRTMFVWLKAKYGFEESQLRAYTFNMTPFLADKSMIQQGYISSEPYLVRQLSGIEPRVFLLADHGYATYSGLVLAKQDLIDDSPDIVQAFVDASVEGWRDYLHGDPAPGDALIKRANPEMSDELLRYAREVMIERGLVDGGDAERLGIGAMTDARWRAHFEVAAAQDRYPADLDYQRAYTLQFVGDTRGPSAADAE